MDFKICNQLKKLLEDEDITIMYRNTSNGDTEFDLILNKENIKEYLTLSKRELYKKHTHTSEEDLKLWEKTVGRWDGMCLGITTKGKQCRNIGKSWDIWNSLCNIPLKGITKIKNLNELFYCELHTNQCHQLKQGAEND